MNIKHVGENAITMLVTLVKTALGHKVDKVDGKGLSTNDYTTEEKNKLAGLAQSDWSASTGGAAILNKPTKLSQFENDSKFITADEVPESGVTEEVVDQKIAAAVSTVYKPQGSSAFADLPVPAEGMEGFVYNVTDSFTTTDTFVEGAGGKYPAGSNVVIVKSGDAYKFDVLAGFVDLSGYVQSSDVGELTNEEITAIWNSVAL